MAMIKVHFEHDKTDYDAEYQRIFNTPIHFNQFKTQIDNHFEYRRLIVQPLMTLMPDNLLAAPTGAVLVVLGNLDGDLLVVHKIMLFRKSTDRHTAKMKLLDEWLPLSSVHDWLQIPGRLEEPELWQR